MKTIKLKVQKHKIKESPEERKDRITQSGNHLVTKIVPNKRKIYNRQKFKRGELL